LQAVLRQTRVALKPSPKPGRSSAGRSQEAPKIDKKALGHGLLALLQHASELSAADPALHQVKNNPQQQAPYELEGYNSIMIAIVSHMLDLLSPVLCRCDVLCRMFLRLYFMACTNNLGYGSTFCGAILASFSIGQLQ